MLVWIFIKMLNILVLCPVLFVAGVQTLTIDSQLGTSVEGEIQTTYIIITVIIIISSTVFKT